MKAILYPTIVAALIVPTLNTQAAPEKPNAGSKEAQKPGDAAWTTIEGMFRGPSKQPKSREEAVEVFTAFLKDFDEKAAAFRKDFPTDSRRWKISLEEVKMNRMRSFVGMPQKDEAAVSKTLGEIVDAKDADAETRDMASFVRAAMMGEGVEGGSVKIEDFEKVVAEHKKAFPESKNISRLDSALKTAKTKAEIMTKPFELKFTATDGSEVDFAKLRGKVVLVDFWATWCGPCVAEVPNVVATYKKLHEKGFEIVGISLDQDKAKLEDFVKSKGMTWVQHFDGKGWKNEIAQKYGINSIPAMWLIDKKGMVVSTNARGGLEEKVEKYLAE